VGVSPDSKYKTNFKVKAIFQVGVHIKNLALLDEIKLFFNVGNISKFPSKLRDNFSLGGVAEEKQFD
jgi:hypothetical protein